MKTGMLYGIMIYKMTGGYDDAAIILADSGMLQSTAEKKHLVLTLHDGEWFENMKSQEVSSTASVPYRRETFVDKKIILDFDGDFNIADASALSNNARGKSIKQISRDIDSLKHVYDSIGRVFYKDVRLSYFSQPYLSQSDSTRAVKMASTKTFSFDSIYGRMSPDKRLDVVDRALRRAQEEVNDLDFKGMLTLLPYLLLYRCSAWSNY